MRGPESAFREGSPVLNVGAESERRFVVMATGIVDLHLFQTGLSRKREQACKHEPQKRDRSGQSGKQYRDRGHRTRIRVPVADRERRKPEPGLPAAAVVTPADRCAERRQHALEGPPATGAMDSHGSALWTMPYVTLSSHCLHGDTGYAAVIKPPSERAAPGTILARGPCRARDGTPV